jgi:(p)ppGpp synthase/HD superfamily hydrolase
MGLLLKRALDQAAVWHRAQRRKYPGVEVPYMSHLAGVVAILARHGFDEEVLAAGALHDAVEDTEASIADIEREFGDKVAFLVDAVSEKDRSLSWEARKHAYIERFAREPWEAQAISLADKIDNFESIVVCAERHGDPWAQFKRGREPQLERFGALERLARELPPHALIDEFCAALERVRAV